jgi:hypothetical protein
VLIVRDFLKMTNIYSSTVIRLKWWGLEAELWKFIGDGLKIVDVFTFFFQLLESLTTKFLYVFRDYVVYIKA